MIISSLTLGYCRKTTDNNYKNDPIHQPDYELITILFLLKVLFCLYAFINGLQATNHRRAYNMSQEQNCPIFNLNYAGFVFSSSDCFEIGKPPISRLIALKSHAWVQAKQEMHSMSSGELLN